MKPINEPAPDRPLVTADVAPPTAGAVEVPAGVTPEGERQTRVAGLRIPTDSLRAYTMIAALVVIWLYFQWATVSDLYPYGVFLHPVNFSKLLQQMAVTGVLAVGMLMVIVAGQIDLSVGSVVALLGGVAGLTLARGYGFAASLAAAVVVGVAIGAVQGGLVAYANIPAFIVTLGGMLAWRGSVFLLTRSETIPIQDPTFKGIGQNLLDPVVGIGLAVAAVAAVAWGAVRRNSARRRHGLKGTGAVPIVVRVLLTAVLVGGFVTLMNAQGGVPVPVVILLASALAGAFLTRNTTFGRYLYAIGGNPDAARLSGISIRRHILGAFSLMGMLAAVAAVLHSARLQNAIPSEGVLMELDAIAACVIGGTSLMGGRGTVMGAVIGALIMASLDNGMSLLSVEQPMKEIIKGAVLVTAVWIDMLGRRKG